MFRGKSTFNLSSAYLIVVVVVGVNNSNTINTVHNEEFSHFETPSPPFHCRDAHTDMRGRECVESIDWALPSSKEQEVPKSDSVTSYPSAVIDATTRESYLN